MIKENEIQLGDLEIQYRVENRDVKDPRIEITPEKDLLIVLPPDGFDERDVIEAERDWISNQIISINEKMSETGLKEERLQDKIILDGEVFDLVFQNGAYGISKNENRVEVRIPVDADEIGYLENWVRDGLRVKLRRLIDGFSENIGVKYNDIFIRKQKTKWASCSSRNNLNFNLKSAALPIDLVEYLVVHELTHLKERNHTEEFWDLLSETCRAPRSKEKQLAGYWFVIHQCRIWNDFYK